ncbi:putative leucine-rich repeat-containing protein DDB_G0290503 isoform X9 [Drosophila mojavensis]|uniref:putative leucine-rich repeat-containing protein DDB_G0290503 isoform X9 n=1 Tax=Drosophila mojavensis TaxID=7230 RepID=UPI001CD11C93|nr:putative leucine-rich repeat-containing protein DDB_G0290503 isoform X9 [Drosophila mojavensis]
MTFTRIKTLTLLVCTLLALSFPGYVNCANKKGSQPAAAAAAAAAPPLEPEAVIEEVNAKQLEKLLADKDYVAVFWYARSCVTCDKVLAELEKIDDDTDSFGVDFVKINDKRLAKQYGIKTFPALTYFREKEPIIYDGDLMDEEGVLDFLTSLEAMDLPDRIEEVNAKILQKIIEDTDFVAVLFYDKDQKKSQKILAELENIDDECDQNDIAFVKIDDDKEAKEWGIDEIPSIVLFERGIPHIYEGDLMKEDELLGWLVHQKRYSEIPEVTDEMKDKLVENTEHLAVIFYDKDDKQDMRILNELENIDDELEKEGIVIVRIDNAAEAKEYGLDHLPALIYFENKIPALYEGDLMNEDEVLEWLLVQKKTATIEEVTDEILVNLINEHEYVVVFFTGPCEPGETCDRTLNALESIDDELDEAGIIFVTTEDTAIAKKYNVKSYPRLVFFRNRDPLHFTGDLDDEDEVLAWITDDETLEIPGKIEEVNVKMLDKILAENDHVVVFFYAEGDKKAQKILNELENIDDECEEKDIDFVKTSDDDIDKEYDLPGLPALAFYRHKFRTIYTGDLMKEEEILEWVIDLHESTADVIESVDRKTLQVLINDVEHLAVFFYDDECETCPGILEELENIDDDTDKHGIQFVKSNDVKLAHEIGIFAFPALVYYETGVPIMYDGNLKNENRVLQWLINQKSNDDDGSDEKIVKMSYPKESDVDKRERLKRLQQTIRKQRLRKHSRDDDDNGDDDDNNDDDDDNDEDNDDDDDDDDDDNNNDNDDDEDDDNDNDNDDEDDDDEDNDDEDEDEDEDEDDDEKDNDKDDEDDDDDDNDEDDDDNDDDNNDNEDEDDDENDKDNDDDEDNDDDDEEEDEDEDKNDDDEDEDDDDEDEDDDENDNDKDNEDDDDNEDNDDNDDDDNDDDDEDDDDDDDDNDNNKDNDNDDDEDEDENDDDEDNDEDDEDNDDDDDIQNDDDDDDEDNDKDNDDDDEDEDEDDNDNDNDDDDDDDKDNDNDDEEEDISKQVYKHRAKGRTIHRLSDLCSGHVIDEIDDECFYVGLGHDGHSAKRGNSYVPNDYKPFQCCPTKLEKSTKVPKMTAQRIGHSDGESSKRQGGNFKFASTTNQKPSSQTPSKPKPNANAQKPTQKRKVINNNDDDDDDNDDDDDDDDDVPLVKVSYANKRSGQSNKKPLNKVQDLDDESVEVEKPKKSSKKSGNKLNVKTGINFFQNRLKNLYDLIFQDISLWE